MFSKIKLFPNLQTREGRVVAIQSQVVASIDDDHCTGVHVLGVHVKPSNEHAIARCAREQQQLRVRPDGHMQLLRRSLIGVRPVHFVHQHQSMLMQS